MKTLKSLESKIMNEKMSFSKEILGPIVYEFCHLLHQKISNFYNEDNYIILYMGRDGFRLRYLYQLYRELNHLKCDLVEKDFYISRLACAKSCLYTDFDYVFDFIMKTEHLSTFAELFKSITKTQELNQYFEGNGREREVKNEKIKQIYEESDLLKNYFWQQHQKLQKYLDDLLQGKEKIIIVDSGGRGNTQGMLMRSFSEYQWMGLYFYVKSIQNQPNPAYFKHIVGISSDDRHHKYPNPRSCIFSHSLLIEALLEINFPSTEEYKYNEGVVMPNTGIASESIISPNFNNPYFIGVIDYFKEQSNLNFNEIHEKANDAYKKLFRLIKFPKKSELSIMDCSKNNLFSSLQKNESINSFQSKIERIKKSPWRSGQTVLEFPTPIARLIQILKVRQDF